MLPDSSPLLSDGRSPGNENGLVALDDTPRSSSRSVDFDRSDAASKTGKGLARHLYHSGDGSGSSQHVKSKFELRLSALSSPSGDRAPRRRRALRVFCGTSVFLVAVILVVLLVLLLSSAESSVEEESGAATDPVAPPVDPRAALQLSDLGSSQFSPFLVYPLNGRISVSGGGDWRMPFVDRMGNLSILTIANETGEWSEEVHVGVTQAKGVVDALFGQNSSIAWSAASCSMSSDGRFVLIPAVREKLWRHSSFAHYVVLDTSLPPSAPQYAFNLTSSATLPRKLALALFSPVKSPLFGGSYGVAVVHQNDLYIQPVTATAGTPVRITADGASRAQINSVQNGIQNWVYEEEVFGSTQATWWSPDASLIAFLRSEQEDVPISRYPWYVPPSQSSYPTVVDIRYPKSGSPNPKVSVAVYNVLNKTTLWLALNDSAVRGGGFKEAEYVTDVLWLAGSPPTLAVQLLNRAQNSMRVAVFTDVETSAARVVSTFDIAAENARGAGWLETFPLVSLGSEPRAVDNFVATIGPNNGFNHVVRFALDSPRPSKVWLTAGDFEVTAIQGYVPLSDELVFQCARASPLDRSVEAISQASLLTPSASVALSPESGYFSAVVPDVASHFYILTDGGPEVPSQTVKSLIDNTLNKVLSANTAVQQALEKFKMPTKKFVEVSVDPEGGAPGSLTLHGYVLTPPAREAAPFAMLQNVYGGPGSQTVSKQWSAPGFNEYLASAHGIYISSTDNRGTGGRGNDWRHLVYRQLGELEARDQRSAAAWFQQQYPSLTKIGIWGWSYGGFVTSSCATEPLDTSVHLREPDFAIAVAPVTDWRYYDSVYTERYMRTPIENLAGYVNTSVVVAASSGRFTLHNNKFMVLHGEADDNVHFQNTAELVLQLQQAGVQFRTMFYPNKDHGIGGKARSHLYSAIESFILERIVS